MKQGILAYSAWAEESPVREGGRWEGRETCELLFILAHPPVASALLLITCSYPWFCEAENHVREYLQVSHADAQPSISADACLVSIHADAQKYMPVT